MHYFFDIAFTVPINISNTIKKRNYFYSYFFKVFGDFQTTGGKNGITGIFTAYDCKVKVILDMSIYFSNNKNMLL